jgi:hypothetical protein
MRFVVVCLLVLLLVACARQPGADVVRLDPGVVAVSPGGRCIQDDQSAVIYPSGVRSVDLGSGDDGARRLWLEYADGTERVVPLE